MSEVVQKILKTIAPLPSITDSNSTASVVGKPLVFFVCTSLSQVSPRLVQTSASQAVGCVRLFCAFLVVAATGSAGAIKKRVNTDVFFVAIAAGTAAGPIQLSVLGSPQNCPSTENLSGDVVRTELHFRCRDPFPHFASTGIRFSHLQMSLKNFFFRAAFAATKPMTFFLAATENRPRAELLIDHRFASMLNVAA